MKKFTQAEKIISVILIFTVMADLTGCAVYRPIPKASLSDYSGFSHVVYGEKTKYILDSTVIADGMFIGEINLNRSSVKNAIKVYPLSFSSMKIDSMNTLTLPVDQIKTVKAPGIYIPKEAVHSKKTVKEKEPAGETILKSLYYLTGLIIVSSLSWYIFEKKRR